MRVSDFARSHATQASRFWQHTHPNAVKEKRIENSCEVLEVQADVRSDDQQTLSRRLMLLSRSHKHGILIPFDSLLTFGQSLNVTYVVGHFTRLLMYLI